MSGERLERAFPSSYRRLHAGRRSDFLSESILDGRGEFVQKRFHLTDHERVVYRNFGKFIKKTRSLKEK